MANKVVVQDSGDETREGGIKKKKKRSKCCTCLIVFSVTCLVLCAVIFGVGWYLGDKYTKQYLNMSLGDTLGVVNDLYWTDDEDVVTKPYKKSDADGFYGEIKKNILLREDADVDFKSALDKAIESYLNKDSSESDPNAVKSVSRASTDGEDGDGSSIMNVVTDMITEVFTKENIDLARLKEYKESNDTYLFELKDNELAAFVNDILSSILSSADKINALSSVNDMIDLKSVVKLKQVRFKLQAKTDEQGNKTAATAADITVWVGLQKAAGQAISKLMRDSGFGWAGGFVSWLGNVILPENVYATITVPLQSGADASLTLNDMDAQERAQMYKLINGILKNTGDMTVDSMLDQFVDMIKPYLDSAANMMNFDESATGVIKLDLLGALANKASEGIDSSEPLTKADFMYTLQALLTTDPDRRLRQLEPYLYDEWYANAEGKQVYKYDSTIDVTGYTKIDYQKEFIKEIENSYSLDFGDSDDLDSVLDMLGISLDGESSSSFDTDSILDMIDKERFNESLNPAKPIDKLRVTDRMLGAVLAGKMDSLLKKPGSGFENISVKLDALTFKDLKIGEGAAAQNHKFALIAAEIDLGGVLDSMGGESMMIDMVKKVLPEKIMFSMEIDITQGITDGQYADAQLTVNDYENTDRVLETIKKFVPDLDFGSLTGEISDMLRNMIAELDEAIGIELVATDQSAKPVTPGELVMPDIFTVVVNTMLLDESGNPVVTNEELRKVIYELNNTDDFAEFENSDGTLNPNVERTDGFVEDVTDMYYLAPPEPITTFEGLTDFLNDDTIEFSSKFRVNGIDPRVKYLAYDARSVEQITPVMTSEQLAGLISEKLAENESIKDLFEVVDVDTSESEIGITLAIDISTQLPEEVIKLMSVNYIYATATVDIAHPVIDEANPENNAYPVELVINSMQQEEYDRLLRITEKLGGSFDIDSNISEFGKILYTQLNNLSDGLGGEGFMRFTDRGMELSSFYEFLSNQMGLNKDEALSDIEWAQKIKNVVQGMFERPAIVGLDTNDNNYVVSDIVTNEPIPDYEFVMPSLGGGSWTDKQFNAYFGAILATNGVMASQTIALSKGDTSEDAAAVRTWLNSKLSAPLTTADDYIVITFNMPKEKFSDSSENAAGFLPASVYATVALKMVEDDKTGDQSFECVGTVFNNMDADEYAVLLNLMGLNPDSTDEGKVNLSSITNDCISKINELTTFGKISLAATDSADSGVGNITIATEIPDVTLP